MKRRTKVKRRNPVAQAMAEGHSARGGRHQSRKDYNRRKAKGAWKKHVQKEQS